MGCRSKEIGWSTEATLLYDILQEIKRMQGILSKIVTYTTTTTTTSTPTTTSTTTISTPTTTTRTTHV